MLRFCISLTFIFTFSISSYASTAALSDGSTFYKLLDKKADKNVVFIHSGGFSSWTYTLSRYKLAKQGFNILTYDMYGMGKSSSIQVTKYSRKIFLRQLTELLAHVGWDRSKNSLFILGTGNGASLATLFAMNNPGKVKKLALIAPAYNSREIGAPIAGFFHNMMKDDPESPWLRLLLKAIVDKKTDTYLASIPQKKRGLVKKFIDKETANFSYYDGLFRRLLGDLYDSYSKTFRALSRSNVPAIVLAGSNDKETPKSQLDSLKHSNTSLELKVYTGLGSEFLLLESADIFQRIGVFFNAP